MKFILATATGGNYIVNQEIKWDVKGKIFLPAALDFTSM